MDPQEEKLTEMEKGLLAGCGFAIGIVAFKIAVTIFSIILITISLYTCAKGIEEYNEKAIKQIERETKENQIESYKRQEAKRQETRKNREMPTIEIKSHEDWQRSKNELKEAEGGKERLKEMEKGLEEARKHKQKQEKIQREKELILK